MINLDDVLRYLAKFITGKGVLDVGIYRFVAVGFQSKLLQLFDRHTQFMGETIENANQHQADDKRKPHIMGIGLQISGKIYRIRKCRTDNQIQVMIVLGRVEKRFSYTFGLSVDGITATSFQGLLYFLTVQVIVEMIGSLA